ncbi:hypothetical protein RF11_10634 [Thelohanellus kitauei]|uniref:SUZ domain-containing protein n=1 Tax=Thelohanellus kitauei TaxID=669202 RepID=A0A0C2MY41_THEKT|nr:hypothetical protein RF11_10634 [Thelohanellus kitauei]
MASEPEKELPGIDKQHGIQKGSHADQPRSPNKRVLSESEEIARDFLVNKFKNDAFTKKIIVGIEPLLLESLKKTEQNWFIRFRFSTPYYRLVAHKLGEYYNCGHEFCSQTGDFTYYYSPDQKIKTHISELAKEEIIEPKKVVKVLQNPNRRNNQSMTCQTENVGDTRSYEEKKEAYIEARSRILGVPIEECRAQFEKQESKNNEPSQENVRQSFLETMKKLSTQKNETRDQKQG